MRLCRTSFACVPNPAIRRCRRRACGKRGPDRRPRPGSCGTEKVRAASGDDAVVAVLDGLVRHPAGRNGAVGRGVGRTRRGGVHRARHPGVGDGGHAAALLLQTHLRRTGLLLGGLANLRLAEPFGVGAPGCGAVGCRETEQEAYDDRRDSQHVPRFVHGGRKPKPHAQLVATVACLPRHATGQVMSESGTPDDFGIQPNNINLPTA